MLRSLRKISAVATVVIHTATKKTGSFFPETSTFLHFYLKINASHSFTLWTFFYVSSGGYFFLEAAFLRLFCYSLRWEEKRKLASVSRRNFLFTAVRVDAARPTQCGALAPPPTQDCLSIFSIKFAFYNRIIKRCFRLDSCVFFMWCELPLWVDTSFLSLSHFSDTTVPGHKKYI